jgi:hypothetical protein
VVPQELSSELQKARSCCPMASFLGVRDHTSQCTERNKARDNLSKNSIVKTMTGSGLGEDLVEAHLRVKKARGLHKVTRPGAWLL